MSVFLTPDKYPILGATYFPPDDRNGRPGFKTILKRIAQMWASNPDTLRENATDTIEQLRNYTEVLLWIYSFISARSFIDNDATAIRNRVLSTRFWKDHIQCV